MSEDKLCQICFSRNFDKECKECKFKSCKKCLHELIIKYANEQPHCPKCNVLFTMEEIYESLGRASFVKEYLPKACTLAFAKEMQKIPLCMDCCALLKANTENKAIMKSITSDISGIVKAFSRVKDGVTSSTEVVNYSVDSDTTMKPNHECEMEKNILLNSLVVLLEQYLKMGRCELIQCKFNYMKFISDMMLRYSYPNDMKNKLLKMMSDIVFNITGFNVETIVQIYNTPDKTDAEIIRESWEKISNKQLGMSKGAKYLFRCPTDNCRGFISTDYVCHICSSRFCKKCLVNITNNPSDHKCKDEDVKSLEEIVSNTKPCPKCSTRIYKISGCSQMFCTNCHTGFDWNTGKIIKHNFHNPHRQEWIQREGGEIECEEFNVVHLFNPSLLYRVYQRNHINYLVRKLNHAIENILSGYTYFELLCNYIMGKITKEQLFNSIKTSEILKIKNTMLLNIYNYYIDSVSDILMAAKSYENVDVNKLSAHCNSKLLPFVEMNKMLPYVKKFSHMSESEFKSTFESICSDIPDMWVPKKCDKHALISLLARHRELFSEFHSYDTEEEIINKITDRCNFLLYRYAYMFKLRKHYVIADVNVIPYVFEKPMN